ncbi:MAG: inositol monophosphatase [Desulfovibrio sp.]|nr:MAG: inositol monophosphatase [Desulfovibrio sp.]
MDLPLVLDQVTRAVDQAGEIIRENWDKPRSINRKGRIDLVTDTDVAVEKQLLGSLAEILPGAGFLAEESSSDADLGDLTWVVDPLDGTTNFAHGLPFVAISVGLWRKDQVVLGVVANPILDETFTAVRGHGARRNGAPLQVSDTAELLESVVCTGFPYTIEERVKEILVWMERALVSCQGLRRYGSAALDLAYVAAGKYAAYYECSLKPWDMAAGCLLVEEAGGKVTEIDGDKGHTLGSETILASNGRVHSAMSRMLRGE